MAPPGRPRALSRLTLAQQLFVLQVVVALVVVLVGTALEVTSERRDHEADTRRQVLAVARSVADAGGVREAVRSPDPTAVLQPTAEAVRRDTGVDFVVVMAPDRTRYSHPDPTALGKPFLGTIAPALAGQAFTETYTGTLGPSVRAVAPVVDGDQVVALVAVGITRERIGGSCGASCRHRWRRAPRPRPGRARRGAGEPPAAPPDAGAGAGRRSPGCTRPTTRSCTR